MEHFTTKIKHRKFRNTLILVAKFNKEIRIDMVSLALGSKDEDKRKIKR